MLGQASTDGSRRAISKSPTLLRSPLDAPRPLDFDAVQPATADYTRACGIGLTAVPGILLPDERPRVVLTDLDGVTTNTPFGTRQAAWPRGCDPSNPATPVYVTYTSQSPPHTPAIVPAALPSNGHPADHGSR